MVCCMDVSSTILGILPCVDESGIFGRKRKCRHLGELVRHHPFTDNLALDLRANILYSNAFCGVWEMERGEDNPVARRTYITMLMASYISGYTTDEYI